MTQPDDRAKQDTSFTGQPDSAINNPYVGPRTFRTDQAHLFFGREREGRDLLDLVIANRVVIFSGQSGAGKSSLINTHLIPGLRAKNFEILPVARVSGQLTNALKVPNVYTYNLMSYLDQTNVAVNHLADKPLAEFLINLALMENQWGYYPDDGDEELGGAEEVSGGDGPDEDYQIAPRALIIDQFEEILSAYPEAWEQRSGFFRQLAQALEEDPYLWLILAIRDDRVAGLAPYAHLLPGGLRAHYYMQPMGVEAALQAIRRPAKQGGRSFAPGVAEVLVDDLRAVRVQGQTQTRPGQYVEPVQLQVVCYQLWENLKGRDLGPIQAEDLRRSGDVDSALAEYYEEAIAAVLADEAIDCTERTLRTWFDTQLITESGIRGFVLQNEESTAGLSNAVVDELQRHFLLRSENRAGGTWIELVHDRFVEPIRRANLNWRASYRHPIAEAMIRWRAADRDDDRLLDGNNLREAEAFAQANPGDITLEERDFLQRSQDYELLESQRQAASRRRVLWITASLVILLLLVLSAWALWSARQAETAEAAAITARQTAEADRSRAEIAEATAQADSQVARALQLATQAQVVKEQKPAQALLLAVEAISTTRALDNARPVAAEQALREVMSTVYGPALVGHEEEVTAVAFHPEGTVVATASNDSTVRVWNLNNLAKEPTVLRGHDTIVRAVAFSPNGRWLATASFDKTARVWDMSNLDAKPFLLSDHEDSLGVVAFSPDGLWLITAGDDATARLWNVGDLAVEPIVLRGHEQAIGAVAFSPDAHWLATADDDGNIRLWDLTNIPRQPPQPIDLSGHFSSVRALDFSPDGRWLASAGRDTTIRLWDIDNPVEEPKLLEGHEGTVNAVVFRPLSPEQSGAERWLATASDDNTVRLWNVDRLEDEPIVLSTHQAAVRTAAFSPDGRFLASAASGDSRVQLWEIELPGSNTESVTLRGHGDAINALAFSPNGHWLITGSDDATARLWNATNQGIEPVTLRGHTAEVKAIAFSPDEQWLASAGDNDEIRLWDLRDPFSEPTALFGHMDDVSDVDFSFDGRWLATGSRDDTAALWDVSDPDAPPTRLRGHTRDVDVVVFSPDGRWLATGSKDTTVRLWDVSDPGREPIILNNPNASVRDLAFSPDGRWLAAGVGDQFSTDSTVWVWNLNSDDPSAEGIRLQGHRAWISAVTFSSDGRWLASASLDKTARVWDLDNPNAEPRILVGHEAKVNAVAFSRDDRWLATGSSDNTVWLWDRTKPTWEPIVLRGHDAPIRAVAFSPTTTDGSALASWLASASEDGTVRLWDLSDLTLPVAVVLQGHQDRFTDLAVHPSGDWLAAAGLDNTIRLWRPPFEELIVSSCRAAGRNLTRSEWRQFLPEKPYRKSCPGLP